jgi:hypothetical protein
MRQVAKYYAILGKSSFSPLDLSPALWLDASDATTITASSGSVSEWRDKSGNARHVAQATAANQPTTGTATQNGRNVIYFDANDGLKTVAKTVFDDPVTVAVVYVSPADSITNQYIWDGFDASNRAPISYVASDESLTVITGVGGITRAQNVGSVNLSIFQCDLSQTIWRLNGVQTSHSGNASLGLLTIGNFSGGGSLGLVGSVAEFVVTNSILTTQQMIDLETYLRNKWGTP